MRPLGGLVHGMVCGLLATTGFGATEVTGTAATQELVTRWARIRQEKIRMESQWTAEQDLLAAMEATLESRRTALADQKRVLEAKTREQTLAQEELAEKNASAKAQLAQADTEIRTMSEALVRLRPRLPPRLSRGLEMAFRSLTDPEATLAERGQYLVTILNRSAQFNQSISCGEEPVALPDGSGEKLVEVAYLGLSCGYALDHVTGKAYVGRPEADGWRWQEKGDLGGAVAAFLAQARDRADPAFVDLPVQVR